GPAGELLRGGGHGHGPSPWRFIHDNKGHWCGEARDDTGSREGGVRGRSPNEKKELPDEASSRVRRCVSHLRQ
ncbi:unnamed protein product, partial [Discosporangium mesarthrocarpum]